MVKVMYNDKLVYKVVIWAFWGISLWKEMVALVFCDTVSILSLVDWSAFKFIPLLYHLLRLAIYDNGFNIAPILIYYYPYYSHEIVWNIVFGHALCHSSLPFPIICNLTFWLAKTIWSLYGCSISGYLKYVHPSNFAFWSFLK